MSAPIRRAAEDQRAVEYPADFMQRREGADQPGMAAGAVCHGDEAVDAGLGRLGREFQVGDVVEDFSAIGLYGRDQLAVEAERGDDQRNAALDDDGQIGLEPRIAAVDDEVDAEGRGLRPEPPRDLVQPVAKSLARALVERRKAADDAGIARFHHEVRPRDQEHRRRDRRQRQPVLPASWNRHHRSFRKARARRIRQARPFYQYSTKSVSALKVRSAALSW
jgi:hypothetical protein